MVKPAWKRYVVIRVSLRMSVVAEPDYPDWHYIVCTKAMKDKKAEEVCKELNEKQPGAYSHFTRKSLISLDYLEKMNKEKRADCNTSMLERFQSWRKEPA